MIRELNNEGLTVFLTTHNIEEASQMCDRIAIINRGKIAVIDTPESIRRVMKSNQSVEVAFKETSKETQKTLEDLSSVIELQKRGDKLRLLTEDPTKTLRQLWGVIEEQGLEPITLNTLGSSLEDAFLQLTGKEMEAEVIKRRRGS